MVSCSVDHIMRRIHRHLRSSLLDRKNVRCLIVGLRRVLGEELYGQHIVSETIPFLLEQHRLHHNPNAALLLGFHGMSGVGKTLVSRIIAEHLYKRGTKSQFVKTFNFQLVEDPNAYRVIRQIDFSEFYLPLRAYYIDLTNSNKKVLP